MAAYDQGALAKYNSLTDRHLVTYFSNERMRQHLIKNGLITKSGEVVPDAVYRVRMARKEHRRRVRDLIAQAIIHKALEMERSRQIDIRKKIEEIAKMELVRRVREDRSRVGDEDCVSYFNPGVMDITPRGLNEKKRTSSDNDEFIMPMTSDEKSRIRLRKLLPTEEIESKHLSQLDSLTLGEYSRIMRKQDRERINRLPYLGLGQSINRQKHKQSKAKKGPKKSRAPSSYMKEGTLFSSRSIQSKVQSLTKLSILFHSPIPNRVYDIMVEQQPSGGNTVILFRDTLTSNSVFSVVSQRHRGFPFSLTFYINNVKDSRISTCCEFRHKVGKRIGGPNGHFSLFAVEGACPCYRCLTEQDMANDRKTNMGKDSKSNEHKNTRPKSSSVQDIDEIPYQSDNEFESESSSEQSGESESEEKSGQENIVENYNNNAFENKGKTANEQNANTSNSPENEGFLIPMTGITKVTIVSKDPTSDRKRDTNETVFENEDIVKENKPESAVSTDESSNIKPINENPDLNNDTSLDKNRNPEKKIKNVVELSPKQESRNIGVISIDEEDYDDTGDDVIFETSKKSEKKEKKEEKITDHDIKRNEEITMTQNSNIIRKNSKQDVIESIDKTLKEEPRNRKISSSTFSSNSSDSEQEKPVTKKKTKLTNIGNKLKINIGKRTPGNSNNNKINMDRKYSLQSEDLMRKRQLLKKGGSLSSLRRYSDSNKSIGLTIDKFQTESKTSPSAVVLNSSDSDRAKIISKVDISNLNNENKLETKIPNEEHDLSTITNSRQADTREDNSHEVDKPMINNSPVRTNSNVPMTSSLGNNSNNLLMEEEKEDEDEDDIGKEKSNEIIVNKGQLEGVESSSCATSTSSYSNSEASTKPDVFPLNNKSKLETITAKEEDHCSVVDTNINDDKNESVENDHFLEVNNNVGKNNLRSDSGNQLLEGVSDRNLDDFRTDKSQLGHKDLLSSATSDSSDSRSKETVAQVDISVVNNEDRSEADITNINADKNESPRVIGPENRNLRKLSDLSNNEDDDLFSSSSTSSSSNAKRNDSDIRSRLIPVKPIGHDNGDELKINLAYDNESSKPSTSHQNGNEMVTETEDPLSIGRGKLNAVLVEETNDDIREQQGSESSSSSEYHTDSDTNELINVDNQVDESGGFLAHLDNEAKSPEIKQPESIKICVEGDDVNFKKAKEICLQFYGASVDSIKIRNCELPNYVFNFISDKLENHSELKSIELSGCEVEISLLNLLAKSLEKWSNLEQLILADNHFTDYSFQNLIDMIKFLYHNDGNSDGFKQNMKLLDLSNCSIQENDLGQLIDMIEKNTRLGTFLLDGTLISPTVLQSVCKALQSNKHIQMLSLQNSGINQTMLDRLGDEFSEDIKIKLKI